MISFERSEKEIKEKKEQSPACSSSRSPLSDRQRQQNYFLFYNQKHIILNAQKEKLSFVRTLVRVLCLLTVRYTPPVPQIFSESINTQGVGGLFGV